MRYIALLLLVTSLYGCSTPDPGYSEEYKRQRINMIMRGIDPDTGGSLAESQRRADANRIKPSTAYEVPRTTTSTKSTYIPPSTSNSSRGKGNQEIICFTGTVPNPGQRCANLSPSTKPATGLTK